MDIGKEEEKEIYVSPPIERPVEEPQRERRTVPAAPEKTPAPEKVPSR